MRSHADLIASKMAHFGQPIGCYAPFKTPSGGLSNLVAWVKKGRKLDNPSLAKLTMNSQVVWYRWNHLDETAFLTGPKPLVTDFDNKVMLELCCGKYFCLGIG